MLSLCVIVRDAESSIRRAVSSANPFVDDIVVVDTGSTDRTRQIAAEFSVRVFEFPWCDDFSAARNFSLDQANCDWIFWMDADDVLPAESGQALRRIIAANPKPDAAFWMSVQEQPLKSDGHAPALNFAHLRLFPRHPQIRFRYRVHEQIVPSVRELGLPIRSLNGVVHHVTDRSPEAQKKRADRNLRLALMDLEDHPNDPFIWFSVGTSYLSCSDGASNAIRFLRRSTIGLPPSSHVRLNAFYFLGQALASRGNCEEEERSYLQGLALFPDDSGLLMQLGALYERSNRPGEAADCYQTVLLRGRSRCHSIQTADVKTLAVLQLGQIYAGMGKRARADELWYDFLKRRPDAESVRIALDRLRAGQLDKANSG